MAHPAEFKECPIEYLRDSAEIAAGLAISGTLQKAILAAPASEFTPLGSIWCEVVEAEIPIGIKKRNDPYRIVREIAILDTILRNDPTLRTAVPFFTVAVHDDSGPIGILTEDFSEDGKHVVEEDHHRVNASSKGYKETDMPTELHARVLAALQRDIYPAAFEHMSAMVSGKAVVVDFDDITNRRGEVAQAIERVQAFYDLAILTIPGSETDYIAPPGY